MRAARTESEPYVTEQIARDRIAPALPIADRIAILPPHAVVLRENPVMKDVEKRRERLRAVAVLGDFIDEVCRHARIDAVQPEKGRADRWRRGGIVGVVFDTVDLAAREAQPRARTEAHGLGRGRIRRADGS